MAEFSLDGGQFRARFVGDVFHLACAAIPIAGVARVALDLVQHGMDPTGRRVVLALHDRVRSLPVAGTRELDGAAQLVPQLRVHGLVDCHRSHPLARSLHAGQAPQPKPQAWRLERSPT